VQVGNAKLPLFQLPFWSSRGATRISILDDVVRLLASDVIRNLVCTGIRLFQLLVQMPLLLLVAVYPPVDQQLHIWLGHHAWLGHIYLLDAPLV
jgi:hypothetical protein